MTRGRSNDAGPGLSVTGSSNGGAISVAYESLVASFTGSTLTLSFSAFSGNEARGGDGIFP